LSNVFDELLRKNHAGYMVDIDDMLACIVNMNGNHPQQMAAELQNIISKTQTFLHDQMTIEFTAAVSGFHDQLNAISAAYTEAMDYGIIIGNDGTVFFQ
jgi:two-component system response regulator YesN